MNSFLHVTLPPVFLDKAILFHSVSMSITCNVVKGHKINPVFYSDSIRMKKEEEASERPDNTAFTQQRLPAWQPILSAGIVIPGFLIIGLAFIGIGIALFLTSQTITVLEVRAYRNATTLVWNLL